MSSLTGIYRMCSRVHAKNVGIFPNPTRVSYHGRNIQIMRRFSDGPNLEKVKIQKEIERSQPEVTSLQKRVSQQESKPPSVIEELAACAIGGVPGLLVGCGVGCFGFLLGNSLGKP